MNLRHEILELETTHVFRISRSAADRYRNVIAEVEHDGVTGIGEAAPSGFYGENAETVSNALDRFAPLLGEDPFALEIVEERLDRCLPGNYAAKAAVDMALHDLIGKLSGQPLHKLFGLSGMKPLPTSFTIGLDEIEVMQRKVEEAKEFEVLKVKVGTGREEDILGAIRQVWSGRLRVDANAAWTAEEAIARIRAMEPYDLEFVEQPVAADDTEGWAKVRAHVDLPVIADESARRVGDIPSLVGKVDGINIKLMKCGGLREALRMIHTARACGMRVMLGCMIESSVAITAAAHLSPLVDYADLDGNLLTSNDPFAGVRTEGGRLMLPDRPGLGVTRREGGGR